MGSTQQFSLKWNKYRQNWDRYLLRALSNHLFSDVMVACDGEVFQLHRVVLASCSAYFEKTLQKIPAKETPIVMLSDVSEAELRTLIEFMYCGEATIDQSRLESLLKAAERLQIRGLVRTSADGESSSEEEEEQGEEAEAARRIEHRQAAAAALASRAPWPAQQPDSPTAGRRSPAPHSPPPGSQTPPSACGGDPLDISRLLSITVDMGDSPPVTEAPPLPPLSPPAVMAISVASEPMLAPPEVVGSAVVKERALRGPMPVPETPVHATGMVPESSTHGGYKRNTSDSPHVQAAVRRIAEGEATVAEASIEFDVPIPTLYLNMRRQGIKARGRLGMTGKRKPRALSMSQEMQSALSEIEAGSITASKASRKYNITLPRIMSWMRKMGVKSAYSRNQQGPQPESGPLLESGPQPESGSPLESGPPPESGPLPAI